jgi:hypothetical protein
MRDLRSPLDGIRSPFGVARGWTPAALFGAGGNGVWLASSTTTCFTDLAGTTPAGEGDLVALMLDQSQGAGYFGGEFTGLGPELVTNGTFDTDLTGWNAAGNWAWSSGSARHTPSGSGENLEQSVFTAGKTYLVSWSQSGDFVAVYADGLSELLSNQSGILSKNIVFFSSSGGSLTFRASSGTVSIDNVSVRELPGNHATQITVPERPALRKTAGGLWYAESDNLDDAMEWTATAGNYTIARLNSAGVVTIQTEQALDGATDIFAVETEIAAYVSVDRALTANETAALTAYLEDLA